VTGEAKVKRYINLRLWLQSEKGTWVELLEEAWVPKDLKVPLLQGEDFHVNYHLSTVRDDCRSQATRMHDSQLVTFPAHFAPPELPSWGSESEHSELQTIVASLRSNQTKSTQAEEAFPPLIRAATRACIPAYTSAQVQVPGPFNSEGDWIVKRLMVTMPDASALSAPSTFIRIDKSGVARIPAANFSPHPCFIQPGEVLGLARNPLLWLDEFSPGAKDSAKKVAVFLGKRV